MLEGLLDYLSQKPFREVNQAIAQLSALEPLETPVEFNIGDDGATELVGKN